MKLHKWICFYQNEKYQYYECEKCGVKTVKKLIYGHNYTPIFHDWLNGKIDIFCKK